MKNMFGFEIYRDYAKKRSIYANPHISFPSLRLRLPLDKRWGGGNLINVHFQADVCGH